VDIRGAHIASWIDQGHVLVGSRTIRRHPDDCDLRPAASMSFG
jgi:hypothetical protein